FGLDGVLGGQDDEGRGEGVGGAADGDLAFGHDLQEGGLDLGGGAVDLVGEDEVDEDGAEFAVERLGGGVGDAGADEAGGDGSGVNWRRAKVPPTTWARVPTARVLATPGTPSRRQWPRASRATMRRSTMCS